MNRKPNIAASATGLRRRAEGRLREAQRHRRSGAGTPKSVADAQRLVHELQVHQVELEMQNAELEEARNRMEALLEKYTDLYDFAPVGYFSLDVLGRILEANLTGAALLGMDRSHLIHGRLVRFVAPVSQSNFMAFLKRVFAEPGKQVCETALQREDGTPFWASLHGTSAVSISDPRKWCRVAVSDITALKRAEEAQNRLEALAVANQALRREIVRRQSVEEALKKSERHQTQLLEQSRHMQEQLRHLSRQVLRAQEDERRKISRELHDVIAQTLTGINVQLAALKKQAASGTRNLSQNITRTQRLVEESVDIVHRFARELRPSVLDDLGLIPALHSLARSFSKTARIPVRVTVSAAVETLDSAKRTVLYRVATEALTNVARHAQATRVEMSIRKLPDGVCMEIKDNGESFDVKRMLDARGNRRLGLLGMRERVEMVGGNFAIESSRGKGTTVRAQIPLGSSEPRRATRS